MDALKAYTKTDLAESDNQEIIDDIDKRYNRLDAGEQRWLKAFRANTIRKLQQLADPK